MTNLIIGLVFGWGLGFGASVLFLLNQNTLSREATKEWGRTIELWKQSEKEWQEKYEEATR